MAFDISKIALSLAVPHKDTLYLSGQVAFDEPGVLVEGGIEAQTKQTMLNIKSVLKSHKLDMKDIIKSTVWLTDKANFSGFNDTYREFFEAGHFPARSTVVSDLTIEGALIEIEVIARLPE